MFFNECCLLLSLVTICNSQFSYYKARIGLLIYDIPVFSNKFSTALIYAELALVSRTHTHSLVHVQYSRN